LTNGITSNEKSFFISVPTVYLQGINNLKLKILCTAKKTLERVVRHILELEKVFASHISHKALIFEM
jgi:hypothetical protein